MEGLKLKIVYALGVHTTDENDLRKCCNPNSKRRETIIFDWYLFLKTNLHNFRISRFFRISEFYTRNFITSYWYPSFYKAFKIDFDTGFRVSIARFIT